MKRKVTIIFISASILIGIYLYCNFRYVPFHTVSLRNDECVVNREKESPEFYDNLKIVLNYYEEDFKVENGMIYIRYNLYKDEDLVWNYTTKANDSVWLSTR